MTYINQEQDFSQIWDLHKNTANNINFCYRPNSKKKKKWLNFPIIFLKKTIFTANIYFFEKASSVTHNTTELLTPCWVPKKKEQMPRKFPDGRTETLIWPFWPLPAIQKLYFTLTWRLNSILPWLLPWKQIAAFTQLHNS